MSWSDILYPDNPERRKTVVRYMQRIHSYLDRSCDAINELVSILNTYVSKEKIANVSIDQSQTIKHNADLLAQKLDEVQRIIEECDRQLAKEIEPDLYRELKKKDLSFKGSLKTAETICNTVITVSGGVIGVAVLTWLSKTKHITQAASKLQAFGKLALAGITVSILVAAVELIVSAIIGAVERSRLETAIAGLKLAVDEFEPACKEFCKTVYTVSAKLELLSSPE